MRPIGRYRFLLPGESKVTGDYYFIANPAKDLFMLCVLQAFYLWIPVTRKAGVKHKNYVIRKVEQ